MIHRYNQFNENKNEYSELADKIYSFLDKYAAINPNWDKKFDDEDDKYTSPDASQMKYCADMLSNGITPRQCWSEWSSGGYKPYTSVEGMEEHNSLIREIYSLINN